MARGSKPPALPANDPVSFVESCILLRAADGARVVRFRIDVRQSAKERKWTSHCFVPVPADADETIAAELAARISSEVENSEHRQARVAALFPNSKTPVSTRPWETPYTDDGTDDDAGLDGDTGQAMAVIVGQTLRHNEVLLMRMQLMADQQIKNLTAQNQLLASQQEAILRDRLDLAKAYREVLLEQAEMESRAKRDETLAESAGTLIQAFAHKLTGGAVATDSRLKNLERLLKAIGDRIDDETAQSLAASLPPDVLIALEAVTTDPLAKVAELEAANRKAAEGAT
jgi:hypothetical protein